MYKLQKIKELSCYRFFQNFRWDENDCNLFKRNNIIYGWNGSGKTTLCDFLKELENRQLSEDGAKASLLFEDTASAKFYTISHNQLGTIPFIFKVFHNSYIGENISEVDKIKHIFAVGVGQQSRIDELKALKERQRNSEAARKTLDSELVTLKTTLEHQKTDKASQIKNAANYTNAYNKNVFYKAYQTLKSPSLLSNEDYQKALSEIRAEKKDEIQVPVYDFIKESVNDYIVSILDETPVNKIIDALKNDSEINKWVEDGFVLHGKKEADVCLFCGNKVPTDRFEALRAHFNRSYKELSEKIDFSEKLLSTKKQEFVLAIGAMPSSGLFYSELRKEYDTAKATAESLAQKNITIINQIVDILDKKKGNMISQQLSIDFATVIKDFCFDYSAFNTIIGLIKKHNSKTTDFQKSITLAQEKIATHMISQFALDIKEAEQLIKNKEAEIEKFQKTLDALKVELDGLDRQVRNSQIPADAINQDIKLIMGRDELTFENSSIGYQISRRGKIAKNLSKGEKNAIALIYFFNTLSDVDSDISNTIIVMDDPISSFDSNFYYNAISYIREKTNAVGQVFIFTHKFSLLKDYSLMYKENANRYLLKRVNDKPILINEDNLVSQYHDEYAYLFKQVYQFVKDIPEYTSDFLQYPNIARRLLEGFLTFKMPNKAELIDKIMALEAGNNTAAGRALLRLLNNHSHFNVIKDGELSEDVANISVLPNTLRYLLEFIKIHDQKHFDVLVSQCETTPIDGFDILAVPQAKEKRLIKLYSLPVSAGFGTSLESDEPYEEYATDNADADFAVKVSGDSMEPNIPDQSILLIKRSEEIDNKKIGIFLFEGNSYCKRKIETTGELLLTSINKKYDPIKVAEGSNFRTFGEVIKVLNDKKH